MALEPETLRNMQIRVAIASIGPSALRGSKTGTIGTAKKFFKNLDLSKVQAGDQAAFNTLHNALVDELQSHLSTKDLSSEFGRCAKALNLFLRDATSHFHLRAAYGFDLLESLLHLPIDSKVSEGLIKLSPPNTFLRWAGVKHLEREEYNKYQKYAAMCATNRGISRIFLDDVFYPASKEKVRE